MDHRGSRKHVLDLTSSGEGPRILTDPLSSAEVVLPSSRPRPVGHDDSTEWDVRRFCRECPPPGADPRAAETVVGQWLRRSKTGPVRRSESRPLEGRLFYVV
jgi:hypothetical protein